MANKHRLSNKISVRIVVISNSCQRLQGFGTGIPLLCWILRTSFFRNFGSFAGKTALAAKGQPFLWLAMGDVEFGALLCFRNKYNFILVECAWSLINTILSQQTFSLRTSLNQRVSSSTKKQFRIREWLENSKNKKINDNFLAPNVQLSRDLETRPRGK